MPKHVSKLISQSLLGLVLILWPKVENDGNLSNMRIYLCSVTYVDELDIVKRSAPILLVKRLKD